MLYIYIYELLLTEDELISVVVRSDHSLLSSVLMQIYSDEAREQTDDVAVYCFTERYVVTI